jgi:hypothetical protein
MFLPRTAGYFPFFVDVFVWESALAATVLTALPVLGLVSNFAAFDATSGLVCFLFAMFITSFPRGIIAHGQIR